MRNHGSEWGESNPLSPPYEGGEIPFLYTAMVPMGGLEPPTSRL